MKLDEAGLEAAIDHFLATTSKKELLYRREEAIRARCAAAGTAKDPETAAIVEAYRRLSSVAAVVAELEGAYSRQSIQRRLKASGYVLKRGKPFS